MFTPPYQIPLEERKKSAHPHTSSLFVERWSPRSFKKVTITQETREAIFDAARWTQSAYNEQPWRIFTSSGESDFATFLGLLVERNQAWAKNASILGFIISKNAFSHNDNTNKWAQFDCGAMWASLTFQARTFGLFTHGMAGIDYEGIYNTFNIPKDKYTVVAGFAIGAIDVPEHLPAPIQAMEKPSNRKTLSEIYFPGGTQLI